MSEIANQEYLLTDQYKDSSNLNARIQLHELFSTNKYGLHRWIFDHYNLPARARILELGCGPGTLWLQNLDRIPKGWDITLSDFSPGMLDDAHSNLRESAGRFHFEVIDAQSILYQHGSFDAVIANHMLYHVPDIPRAISELRRMLRPGVRLYAATLGEDHMQELDELLARFDPQFPPMAGRLTARFTLENGREQLARWFPHVTLYRYDDALRITEAGPLVAYLLSGFGKREAIGDRLDELARFVEEEIASKGAVHVTKDPGLFEAVRPEGERS